jgi:hypothetical protein
VSVGSGRWTEGLRTYCPLPTAVLLSVLVVITSTLPSPFASPTAKCHVPLPVKNGECGANTVVGNNGVVQVGSAIYVAQNHFPGLSEAVSALPPVPRNLTSDPPAPSSTVIVRACPLVTTRSSLASLFISPTTTFARPACNGNRRAGRLRKQGAQTCISGVTGQEENGKKSG